jgi:glutamate-1-semialdehyde 2,1-aminomutase
MSEKSLWALACECIPGGVNSPVRAFGGVGGEPVFMKSGKGAYLYDEAGKAYIDFVLSWGPWILGHTPLAVASALEDQISRGLSFGTCTRGEVELAELILKMVPGMDQVRLVNSGTEATMTAVRIARGYTGRDKIVKFRGCYHGHGDSFLIQAGSGALTHGTPSSLGVTHGTAQDTLVAAYNHLEEVEELFSKYGEEIACVIVEPVAGNMGVVPPRDGFLAGLRQLCTKNGSVLIFDEVMTSFRTARGGCAERFGIKPDMITLGKIVGGGMPLAAYAGKREIMAMVSPLGGVYQAGTLSGNPMAVAAGIAHLKLLDALRPWNALEAAGKSLREGLARAAADADVPVQVNGVGSMFTVFFSEKPVTDTDSALAADTKRFAKFFRSLLADGVYFPPSQFESCFLSTEHSRKILEETIDKAETAFKAARG